MIASILIAAAIQTASPWLVQDQTSPLDGRRSVTAGIESSNGVGNEIGRLEKPMLAITCANGIRGVSIMWVRYLGSGEPIVVWKFDEGALQQRGFQRGRRGDVIMLTGSPADRFMDDLASAQRVVVRVLGQDAVFEVPGAGEQVALVREACPRR